VCNPNKIDCDFDLPDSDFVSGPPVLPFEEAFAICEEMLPRVTSQPDFDLKRFQRKIDVEFIWD